MKQASFEYSIKLLLIAAIAILIATMQSCTASRYNSGITNGCMGKRSGLIGY